MGNEPMFIKEITGKEEQEQYSKLCKYCFVDEIGWTDRIFENRGNDCITLGAFEDDSLKSGMISVNYTSHLFGSPVRMSGISAVASYPEARNKGYVRNLMKEILDKERKSGALVSSLYPFSFHFYSKFGFGSIGEFQELSFAPEHLRIGTGHPAMEPFDFSEAMYTDLCSIRDGFYTRYDFGCKFESRNMEQLKASLQFMKQKIYIGYIDGQAKSFLQYSLQKKEQFSSSLVIHKLGWKDREGFLQLLAHLATHRSQCAEIRGSFPVDFPIHHFTGEPRVYTQLHRSWMARPLNIKDILQIKLDEYSGDQKEIVFSIEDPLFDDETATYTIVSGKIKKQPYTQHNILSLDTFSSLLFGGLSPKDAYLAGKAGEWILEYEGFIDKKRQTFLSENF